MPANIRESSLQLADLMKQKPQEIERPLVNEGTELIALFEDENFGDRMQNLRELKQELFLAAIDDLAFGAKTLKSSQMGLSFQNGKIKTFITPLGKTTNGNIVASISLKNAAAFKKWRNGSEEEIPQEHLNTAIYKLIYELSRIL